MIFFGALGVAGKIYSLPNQGDTTTINLTELTLDKTGYGVFEICETNDYSSMIIANRYATAGLQVISDSDTRPVLNLFDIEKTVAGPTIKITAKTTMQNGGVFVKAL